MNEYFKSFLNVKSHQNTTQVAQININSILLDSSLQAHLAGT